MKIKIQKKKNLKILLLLFLLTSCEDLFLRFSYETYECEKNQYDLKKIILSNKREGDFAEIFIAEKFYKVKLKENSRKTLVLSNLDPKIHIKIDKKTSSAIVNLDNNLFSLKCKKYLFRM